MGDLFKLGWIGEWNIYVVCRWSWESWKNCCGNDKGLVGRIWCGFFGWWFDWCGFDLIGWKYCLLDGYDLKSRSCV